MTQTYWNVKKKKSRVNKSYKVTIHQYYDCYIYSTSFIDDYHTTKAEVKSQYTRVRFGYERTGRQEFGNQSLWEMVGCYESDALENQIANEEITQDEYCIRAAEKYKFTPIEEIGRWQEYPKPLPKDLPRPWKLVHPDWEMIEHCGYKVNRDKPKLISIELL